MKLCLFYFAFMVSPIYLPETEFKFEQAAFEFFVRNFQNFLFSQKDTVDFNCKSLNSLDRAMFLGNNTWHDQGIVKNKSYSSYDSLENTKTNLYYSIIAIPNSRICYNSTQWHNQHWELVIYKRFYYDGFIYVYLFVERKQFRRSALIKFYEDKIVDSCFINFVQ